MWCFFPTTAPRSSPYNWAWSPRSMAEQKESRIEGQQDVRSGAHRDRDSYKVCGVCGEQHFWVRVLGVHRGLGRSGDPQLDPAASKEDQRLDQINLGLPVPQKARDEMRLGV